MEISSLEQYLNEVEEQFHTVSQALGRGDLAEIHSRSAALQQLAVGIMQMSDRLRIEGSSGARLTSRIMELSRDMSLLRENLLRRSVQVERALDVVVPSPAKSTYATNDGPYAAAIRQSGQFKVLCA